MGDVTAKILTGAAGGHTAVLVVSLPTWPHYPPDALIIRRFAAYIHYWNFDFLENLITLSQKYSCPCRSKRVHVIKRTDGWVVKRKAQTGRQRKYDKARGRQINKVIDKKGLTSSSIKRMVRLKSGQKVKFMVNQFERNVFINCPFDDEYRLLLKPLLFTLRYCKLTPRIASERLDSSEIRLEKILEIIQDSKYSIHDLSRIKSSKKGEYYRLNMPLEIGLDLGCKVFHSGEKYRGKNSLILEGERYSLHKGLSDLSGSDVKCHDNDAEKMVESVRSWLVEWDNKHSRPQYDLGRL
ncbi:MAG: hypothetical protein IPJ82_11535 [Lewinellaceae bacterium]|nr:hypothetical protein [Lewinellaceae bacterium]